MYYIIFKDGEGLTVKETFSDKTEALVYYNELLDYTTIISTNI